MFLLMKSLGASPENSRKIPVIPKIPEKFPRKIPGKFPENSRKIKILFIVKYNVTEQKSTFLFL